VHIREVDHRISGPQAGSPWAVTDKRQIQFFSHERGRHPRTIVISFLLQGGVELSLHSSDTMSSFELGKTLHSYPTTSPELHPRTLCIDEMLIHRNVEHILSR
jgi:hypothetical protein